MRLSGLRSGGPTSTSRRPRRESRNPPSSGACLSTTTPPCIPFSFPGTAGNDGEWLFGGTVGAGLDVALTRNVFARAEYEYVYFEPIDGVQIAINTVRVGAGVKF